MLQPGGLDVAAAAGGDQAAGVSTAPIWARQARRSSYATLSCPHVHGCMSSVSRTHADTLTLLPRRGDQLSQRPKQELLLDFIKLLPWRCWCPQIWLAEQGEGRNAHKCVTVSITTQTWIKRSPAIDRYEKWTRLLEFKWTLLTKDIQNVDVCDFLEEGFFFK